MKYDMSVLIPSIRTTNWKVVLDTLKESCKKYTYEVVFIGPFDPPPGIDMTGVKFIKSYRCPSAAAQIGAIACEGDLIHHTVDDAKFIPGAIDAAIDLYRQICRRKDVVNMRYTEDDNYSGKTFPPEYWNAHYHGPLRLSGVLPWMKISCHFLIDRDYFYEMGGFDCNYEYLNFNLHDLMFRIQADSGHLYDSPTDVTNCNHYGGRSVDHWAIEDTYPHDYAKFVAKFSNPQVYGENPLRIDLDNWKNQPEYWDRRFGKKVWNSYEEMIGDK